MPDRYKRVPHRTIRVPDDEWLAAQQKAEERGESLSEAVRRFLKRYASR
jgi:hypothetical protein